MRAARGGVWLVPVAAAATLAAILAMQSLPIIAAALAGFVVLMAFTRLDGWQRCYALVIVLSFFSTSRMPELIGFSYYSRYLALAALALWTWRDSRNEALQFSECNVGTRWLVVGFWLASVVAAVSTLWSFSPRTTVFQTAALVLLAAVVHGLVTRRWRTNDQVAADISVGAWILGIIFAVGVVADLTGVLPPPAATSEFTADRLRGLFDNPNTMGYLAAVTLAILWGLWRHSRKYIYLLGIIPTAAALLMSESRTALVSVGIAVGWVVFRDVRRGTTRLMFITGGAVVVLSAWATGLVNFSLVSALEGRFTYVGEYGVLTGRTIAWDFAFATWQEHPITGIGYGAGPVLFRSSQQEGLLVFGPNVVHNSYLEWLLGLGLVGFLPMFILIGACLMAASRGRLDGLGSGLVATVVAGLSIHFTESSMLGTGQPYPYLFWLAVTGALLNSSLGHGSRPTTSTRGATAAVAPSTDQESGPPRTPSKASPPQPGPQPR